MSDCKLCGKCCMNNGLIPPVILVGESPDHELSAWLKQLVHSLCREFADVAEDHPCVFLTDDMKCAIHDLPRPTICEDFRCQDEP